MKGGPVVGLRLGLVGEAGGDPHGGEGDGAAGAREREEEEGEGGRDDEAGKG